jgi:CheY-like chemotaxis protein
MLQALGCHADLASNGREVLEALKRKPYDVVLMDCQMPEMDGFEATRRIREIEASSGLRADDLGLRLTTVSTEASALSSGQVRRLPIVAVTAHAITGDRDRCLAAGMDDYLSKPFMQDQLKALLRRWMPSSLAETTVNGVNHTLQTAPNAGEVRRLMLPDESGAPLPSHENVSTRRSNAGPGDYSAGSYVEVPTIDPRAWESIRSLQRPGHPDMLCKVIGKYLTSSQQLMETMRMAVPRHDAAALHRTAHSLKSSSATLGALRLAALCKEAESMGRTNTLEGMPSLWEQLEAEYTVVQEALTAELNQVRT